MIDYAPHTIHLTYLLKRLQKHLLAHQLLEAQETSMLILSEAKLLQTVLQNLADQPHYRTSSNVD